jgi:hypothetical protein
MLWFKKKKAITNPEKFGTATNSQINSLIKEAEQKRAQSQKAKQAADLGICPSCATMPLKEIGYHDLSGESKYYCNTCGWMGYGETHC